MLSDEKAELEKKLIRAEKTQNEGQRVGKITRIREELANIDDLDSLNWLTKEGKYNIPVKRCYIPAIIKALKKLDEDFCSDLDRKYQAYYKDVQEEERKLQNKECLSPIPLQEARERLDEIAQSAVNYDSSHYEDIMEALTSQVDKGIFFLSKSLNLGIFEWISPDKHVVETADYTNWLQFKIKPIPLFRRIRQKQDQVAVNDQEEEKKDDWIQKKIVELGKVQKSVGDLYKICNGENVKELVMFIIRCITNYLNCAKDIKNCDDQRGSLSKDTIQFLKSRKEKSRSRHVADLLNYQQDILDKILDYDFRKLLYSKERRAFEDLMGCLIRVCSMQEDWGMDLGAIYADVNVRLVKKYTVYTRFQGGVTKHDSLSILLFLNSLLLRHGEKGRKCLSCMDEPYIRWLYCQEDLVDFTTYFLNMSHLDHNGLSLMPSWYTGFRQFTYEIALTLGEMTFKEIENDLNRRQFHLQDEKTQLRCNHPNQPFQIRVKKEGVVNKKGEVQQAQFVVSLLGTPANLNANSETFKCGPLPTSKKESSVEDYVIVPSTQSLTNKVESNKRWNCHDPIIEGAMHFNYVSSQKKKK